MKKVTKFFMAALLAGMCSFGYAQDYLKPPKANERILGTISVYSNLNNKPEYYNTGSKGEWHYWLLEKAKKEYIGKKVQIRNMQVGSFHYSSRWETYYHGPAVGTVVYTINPEEETPKKLIPAVNKALLNVQRGSRMALDQLLTPEGMDTENLKDQLIDVLLEKGYRVVAKEHLQKLYNEQKDQQDSGFYNPDTTVEGSNFSAVGYFINVKVTETSIRVQVVNVSTGEYEGNATVNF